MKTRREIIEETKEYYLNHPRAVRDEKCLYLDIMTGNRCAIGRYSNSEILDLCTSLGITSFLGVRHENTPDPYLVKEVHGHSLHFWHDLQNFHDMDEHWDGFKLTNEGQKFYDYLLETWSE